MQISSVRCKIKMRAVQKTLREEIKMHLDFRVLVVLLPVLLAGGWAVYNIGALALRQAQGFFDNRQA